MKPTDDELLAQMPGWKAEADARQARTRLCSRCGAVWPASCSVACLRRRRRDDLIVEAMFFPFAVVLWPIGTAFDVWDRFMRTKKTG